MFGSLDDCRVTGDVAVVHACKNPCHQNVLGYKGNLSSDHEHYLSYEKGYHLYLNLIDPSAPLFKAESFDIFFAFVDRAIQERAVLIHCNLGQSRAPSLTLLYMAKRLGILPDESYEAARAAFEKKFPYTPSAGIVTYLTQNWDLISERIGAGNR
jgi:hypothetical protein